MPFHTIIPATSEVYYTPSFLNPDFGWLFQRDGLKWAAIERAPSSGHGVDEFPFRPAIFTSGDGGTSWALEDGAGSPEGVGDIGPAFDTNFLGAGNLACFLDTERTFVFGVGYSYVCHIAIFDCVTKFWGAPFAAFTITDHPTAISRARFASRPDGSYVLVLSTVSGVQAWIGTGGGWAGPSTLVASGTALHMVIDSENRAHVFVGTTCYLLDTDGSVLSSVAVDHSPVGPVRIKSGDRMGGGYGTGLIYPSVSGADIVLVRGVPTALPVWSEETVALASTISAAFNDSSAVLVTESPANGVDVGFGFESSTDSTDNRAGMFSRTASSQVQALYWIGSDSASILRSAKVGSVWSIPDTVFSTSDGTILSLAVTDSVGGGIGARYYADNR